MITEVHLHNPPTLSLAPILEELASLYELTGGEEDTPYELRLCMWDAVVLCGGSAAEPQKTEDDIEDEEDEEKAAGVKRGMEM